MNSEPQQPITDQQKEAFTLETQWQIYASFNLMNVSPNSYQWKATQQAFYNGMIAMMKTQEQMARLEIRNEDCQAVLDKIDKDYIQYIKANRERRK